MSCSALGNHWSSNIMAFSPLKMAPRWSLTIMSGSVQNRFQDGASFTRYANSSNNYICLCTHAFVHPTMPNIIKQPMNIDPHKCATHLNRVFQHPIIQEFINIIWSKHARGFASSNPPRVCTQLYTQHDPSVPKQTVALVMSIVSFFFLQSTTR